MNIINSNILIHIDEILFHLDHTKFITIDLEFSGIKTDFQCQPTDTPMEHFEKRKEIVKTYNIIQFGISLFKQHQKNPNQIYQVKTFIFYLKPGNPERNITINNATLEFLNFHQGIDFNIWLKQGINYYSRNEIDQIKDRILTTDFQRYLLLNQKEKISKQDIEKVNDQYDNIIEWIQSYDFKSSFKFFEQKNEMKKLLLDKIMSSNILKQLQGSLHCLEVQSQNIQFLEFQKKKYPNNSHINFTDNYKKKQEFLKITQFNDFWEKFKEKIVKTKIPIVGHNLLLDLMFLVQHFDQQLTTYQEFKNHLHQNVFPVIYDTKQISCYFKLNKYSLQELEECIQKNQFLKQYIQLDIQNEDDDLSHHNAGKDSQTVGYCYLNMLKNIGRINELQNFKNKLKLFGNHFFNVFLGNETDDFIKKNVKIKILYLKHTIKELKIENFKQQISDNFTMYIKQLENENSVHLNYKFFIHQKLNSQICIFFEYKHDDTWKFLENHFKKQFDIKTLNEHIDEIKLQKYQIIQLIQQQYQYMESCLVFASCNVDKFITVKQFPKEGETIFCQDIQIFPGGKGHNVACFLKNLQSNIQIVACLGQDNDSNIILDNFKKLNLDQSLIQKSQKQTGQAFIVKNNNAENYIIVNKGANYDIQSNLIPEQELKKHQYLYINFETPFEENLKLIKRCQSLGITIVVNFSPFITQGIELLKSIDILVVNSNEFEELLQQTKINDPQHFRIHFKIYILIITLGNKGVKLYSSDNKLFQDCYKVQPIDTTGAGDSFLAGFLSALMRKKSLNDCLKYGQLTASNCIKNIGCHLNINFDELEKQILEQKNFKQIFNIILFNRIILCLSQLDSQFFLQ